MIPFNPLKALPPEPWKPRTYYRVKVSWRPGNCLHSAILYTGFLTRGKPAGYSGLFSPNYEPEFLPLDHSHTLLITSIKELITQDELDGE